MPPPPPPPPPPQKKKTTPQLNITREWVKGGENAGVAGAYQFFVCILVCRVGLGRI